MRQVNVIFSRALRPRVSASPSAMPER
jgi:hypothetical protein